MSHNCTLPRKLLVLLGVVLSASALQAQNPPRSTVKPGVYQMELYNGPIRTVHYSSVNASPGEEAAVKEIARLDNESAYAQNLLALKRQYVNSERQLEPYRALVQQDLYGRSVSISNFGSFGGGYGYGYGGYGIGSYGYPYYRSGYGLGGYPGMSQFGGSTSMVRSLANGVGYEGALKNELSKTIAEQANPTFAAAVANHYDRAASVAAAFPRVRVAMGLPTPEAMRKERNGIRQADEDLSPAPGVTVYLKSGARIRGSKISPVKDGYKIDRIGGGTTEIKESAVERIDIGATGISPAAK
jgi:hypothetical protein